MKRQGVHYHIKNGNFGEPFYGLVPPGRQLDNNAATGRPAAIWLKLDSVLGYYRKKSDIFRLESIYNLAVPRLSPWG